MIYRLPISINKIITTSRAAIFLMTLLTVIKRVSSSNVFLLRSLRSLYRSKIIMRNNIIMVARCLTLNIDRFEALIFMTTYPRLDLVLTVTRLMIRILARRVRGNRVVINLMLFRTIVVVFRRSVIRYIRLNISIVRLRLTRFQVIRRRTTTRIVCHLLDLERRFINSRNCIMSYLTRCLQRRQVITPFSLITCRVNERRILRCRTNRIPTNRSVYRLNRFLQFLRHQLI